MRRLPSQPPIRASVPSGSALGAWLSACIVAVVYATLYPWSGWRAPGWWMFSFLSERWPRWWTGFDVTANVVAYVPIGFLLAAWLARRPGRPMARATAFATLAAAVLSLGLECVQALLPQRVPSRLDLLANAAGGIVGALLAAALGPRRIERWPGRLRGLLPLAPRATLGVILLCAWLLAQLGPQRIAFATGDWIGTQAVDPFVAWLPGWRWPHEFGQFAQAAGVATTVVAVGLIARELLRRAAAAVTGSVVAAPIVAAIAIKALAALAWSGRADAFGWLGAGVQGGLLAGAVALLLLAFAARRTRLLVAISAIVAATLVCNLAAPSAYDLAARTPPASGAWASLHALARALAAAWPLAAVAWCAARLRASPRNWRL